MPFEPEEIAGFLKYKPISVLWGVGRKTVKMLKPYGITVCGDIQTIPVERLAAILGSKSAANALKNFALGVSDDNVYWEPSSEKSVSNEHTFGEDEPNRDVVRSKLIELAESVGRRFRREKRWAKTAKIKFRNAAFETVSKQMPFESPARDDISFREKAIALFDMLWPENEPQRYGTKAARLVGFGVTNIQDVPDAEMQPDLFESTDSDKLKKRERLSAALDKLHDRGLNVVAKSTLKR